MSADTRRKRAIPERKEWRLLRYGICEHGISVVPDLIRRVTDGMEEIFVEVRCAACMTVHRDFFGRWIPLRT